MGAKKAATKTKTGKTKVTARKDQAALWTLRALVRCFNEAQFRKIYDSEEVLETVGIPDLDAVIGFETENYRRTRPSSEQIRNRCRKAKKLYKKLLAELEKADIERDGCVFKNIEILRRVLGFTQVDCDLLALFLTLSIEQGLNLCLEKFPKDPALLAVFFSEILGFGVQEIVSALSKNGILRSMRFLVFENYYHRGVSLVMQAEMVTPLLADHPDERSLLSSFFTISKESKLTRNDYPHVTNKIDFLARYIANAAEKRAVGVNILIHGPTGTGKTELARVIAAELGFPLYEVNANDEDGDTLDGTQRINAYLVCQRALCKTEKALILFDEIEDVFPQSCGMSLSFFFQGPRQDRDKGGMNQILEENRIPTIWVSNAIQQIDPAYLRRFDFVLKLDEPPRAVRKTIFRKLLTDLDVTDSCINAISDNNSVTPADVERAAKVVKVIGSSQEKKTEETLECVLSAALTARGCKLRKHGYKIDTPNYDLGYLNPDCDLDLLIRSVRERPKGNICLFGPPGSGKTAFAYHLARTLDMEVVRRLASDLLSMWVGGTESNLASMFQCTDTEREILLLDEADSFLRGRETAIRSWEVTQVNELLVQMEAFQGLFICSTNLMDNLDQAAFRRFGVKIRFGYMKPEQRMRMFQSALDHAGIAFSANAVAAIRPRLDRLDTLTPGDFAAIRKKTGLLKPLSCPDDLIFALEQECSFKKDTKQNRIGFG